MLIVLMGHAEGNREIILMSRMIFVVPNKEEAWVGETIEFRIRWP